VTQLRGDAAFAPAMIRALGAAVPEVTRALGKARTCAFRWSAKVWIWLNKRPRSWCSTVRHRGHTDLHDCGIPAADAAKLLAFPLRNVNHDRQLDRHREATLAAIKMTIAPE
jgi:hypothetical protein